MLRGNPSVFLDEIHHAKTRVMGLVYGGNCRILTSTVLADRTNGRAYATTLRPSVVCLSVTLCIAAKRYVLEQKLLLTAYRNFIYQESIDTIDTFSHRSHFRTCYRFAPITSAMLL